MFGEITGDRGQRRLAIRYKGSEISVEEVNEYGIQQLKISLDGKSKNLEQYQSIDELLFAIKADMIVSPELYSAFDDDEFPISTEDVLSVVIDESNVDLDDVAFLQLSFKPDDLIINHPVNNVQKMQDKEIYLMQLSNGKTYYCKEMTQQSYGGSSIVAGISEDDPKYGMRSFFTYQCSELLALDVVAHTGLIKHHDIWYYGL